MNALVYVDRIFHFKGMKILKRFLEDILRIFYSKVAIFCVKMVPFWHSGYPTTLRSRGQFRDGSGPGQTGSGLVPVLQNSSDPVPVFWVSGTLIQH